MGDSGSYASVGMKVLERAAHGSFDNDATTIAMTLERITGGKLAADIEYIDYFLNEVVNFLIIAFVIFLAHRGINRLKTQPPPAADPAPAPEVVLLTEIRDLLKQRG